MAELLLELFSEEIPARMQARAAEDLKGLVTGKLKAAGLEFSSADAYVTPRRLTLVVDGLPDKQPDVSEERRGPRVDAPEKAIQGFLGSTGLTLDQCEKRDTGKGEFWFVVIEKKGAATADVLPEIILSSIRELPWPKSMRWGRNTFRWVRPLHHILAVFDGAVLDGGLDLGETQLTFTGETRGHRFLAPDAVTVGSFHEYRTEIGGAFVMLDREDRKEAILAEAKALCEAEGLVLRDDPGLLDEVCGLVEWPVPLMGRIDAEFMSVPPEVLVTSMRSHQKYFAVEKPDGTLADRFILVSNMASEETRNANITAGNEKVLRARLSDAKFFWDQDRAVKLADRRDALRDVKFYDKLGTMADKVERVSQLAAEIAPMVGADADTARHAATLAKADLTTGMVGEFPELQGLMGRYYALDAGEDAQVADAIAQHYSPVGPTDTCPTAPVSVAVAMADKIDTLVGFFAIGETPTGSKDPFALRRAALGVIRLIIENGLRISLLPLFAQARARIAGAEGAAEADAKLLDFFADRLKVHLREQGVRHDLIAAVFELGGEDDLVRLLARVHALADFLATDDGANLLAGYRRASNILRAEEKKDGPFSATEETFADRIDPSILAQAEETALYDAVRAADTEIGNHLAAEAFTSAMASLSNLRGPIDAFFDAVTVNADDAALRTNRLRLLDAVRTAMGNIADFSRVEG
ncbi:glycine--tRNA ligase subunit beta [Thalassobaculum litoreum]|uniref:Glycine--tRNA ligase beta subunit n=1 Tax=Thalassobaculum litoreum DSM 18839 TaxID=1123362 RepID=A0A8G2BMB7_9PROT|nr:glycine--tRNA ligase subunit beta [Thalassobaculum litoreum]SDG52294.1 glycyl-tRNA synthetase beta chain [Thalassobaculum litoreum DSM 18839]